MRVIAGSKRRTLLETPEGDNTRPTQDRIKETLFNMIGPDVYGCVFLDLFSGSGQMGIEALSRGAQKAYFIEQEKNALKCINNNLRKTDFSSQSVVYSMDVFSGLNKIDEHIDFVFMDPPYNKLLEKKVLDKLKDEKFIDGETIIIVEASLETDFSYLDNFGYELLKEKDYKTNKHMFIKKA